MVLFYVRLANDRKRGTMAKYTQEIEQMIFTSEKPGAEGAVDMLGRATGVIEAYSKSWKLTEPPTIVMAHGTLTLLIYHKVLVPPKKAAARARR